MITVAVVVVASNNKIIFFGCVFVVAESAEVVDGEYDTDGDGEELIDGDGTADYESEVDGDVIS